ncbi:hypothetical protein [Reinekea sp. G2M2-21]|uniref:hypothetical protein n=1 Tax=Reinekea sp. G2M2-21 TaxID=2788942 RepID=UPI0018AA1C8A|nr:hypothetical protein [Reinekea sp. G2M2-21]
MWKTELNTGRVYNQDGLSIGSYANNFWKVEGGDFDSVEVLSDALNVYYRTLLTSGLFRVIRSSGKKPLEVASIVNEVITVERKSDFSFTVFVQTGTEAFPVTIADKVSPITVDDCLLWRKGISLSPIWVNEYFRAGLNSNYRKEKGLELDITDNEQ